MYICEIIFVKNTILKYNNMKTNEVKILEEIRSKVFERDREIEESTRSERLRYANIVSLAEFTKLSVDEIDDIANKVHKETNQKEQSAIRSQFVSYIAVYAFVLFATFLYRQEIELSGLLILSEMLGGGYLLYNFYKKNVKTKSIIIDNFNNRGMKWSLNTKIAQVRAIVNNEYVFETDVPDYCYWDTVPFDFPENFTIECAVNWISGKYDEYGLVFTSDSKKYLAISLHARGAAKYTIMLDDVTAVNRSWSEGIAYPGYSKQSNVLKVIFKGENFEMFCNGRSVYTGDTKALSKFVNFGVRNCGSQKVAFKSIKITNNDSNEVLFDDNFSNPCKDWESTNVWYYKKYFDENQRYIIETNRADWHYWSQNPIEISGDCCFSLKCTWLSGESNDFGLKIFENEDDNIGFYLNSSGKAHICTDRGGKQVADNAKSIDYQTNGENSCYIIVRIKNKYFQYFVNETFVVGGFFITRKFVKVGVSVCGYQKVAFEKLIIEEF